MLLATHVTKQNKVLLGRESPRSSGYAVHGLCLLGKETRVFVSEKKAQT